ncbi:MAG TPA: hypothetical protein VGQ41_11940 [Pyrinomonadaceae bacterium]|jgi:hypothetical protein|nr:hypothetical protein [Pyrinomonadaceae bacterium]
MAVEGRLTRVEDDTPIEHWKDLFHAPIRRGIPQLKMSTVRFVPVLVEEQQQIYATIQLQVFQVIEVGMNRELALRQNLMQSAARDMRVRNQAVNASKCFQKSDHWMRIKSEDDIVNEWVKTLQSLSISDPLFARLMNGISLTPIQPYRIVGFWKNRQQSFRHAHRQKVVN